MSISISSSSSNARTNRHNEKSSEHKDERVSVEQLCTLLVGGLQTESGEDACTKIVTKEIQSFCQCSPSKIYSKGQFKGILWVKFESTAVRDRVAESLRKHKDSFPGSSIWCAADLPIAMRVERKFLFQLKRLLIAWSWQPFEVRVDTDTSSLSISNHLIVSVCAHSQSCTFSFADGWDQRLASPELEQFKQEAISKMAARQIGKGVGKSGSQ